MSSSDEDQSEKKLDRSLLVKMLSEKPIVLEKSKIPSVMKSKKEAWEQLTQDYSAATGRNVSTTQLLKLFNNMKAAVKKKTDLTETGNKPVKLKGWENTFFDFLCKEDNPVYKKVPGSASAGTQNIGGCSSLATTDVMTVESTPVDTDDEDDVSLPMQHKRKMRKSVQTINKYERDETKNLSTPQLQRIVLLQQFELNKLHIEMENLKLQKLRKEFDDKATQTEDFNLTDYLVFHNM